MPIPSGRADCPRSAGRQVFVVPQQPGRTHECPACPHLAPSALLHAIHSTSFAAAFYSPPSSCSLWYCTVSFTPSRKLTVGAQPRTCLAREGSTALWRTSPARSSP